jgi:hypothetical protein
MAADPIGAPRRNIAVLAVHGVGDQQPQDTARKISDLLQDLDLGEVREVRPPPKCPDPAAASPQYTSFVERQLRVNVRPVVMNQTPAERSAGMTADGAFTDWVEWYRKQQPSERTEPMTDDENRRREDDVAFAFMQGQLRCSPGEGPEETYETVRVEGRRLGDDPRLVHVYELYWADLSRLKAGLLSIFTEFYQLLFHLSSLGTHAVNAEAALHPGPKWTAFRRSQGRATWALAVPVPLFNLLMLAITVGIAAQAILYMLPPAAQTVATFSVVATVLAALGGVWCWRKTALTKVAGLTPIVLWFAAFIAIIVLRNRIPTTLTHVVAVICSLGAALGLVKLAVDQYDVRRPGVKKPLVRMGLIILALTVGSLVIPPWTFTSSSRILVTLVRGYEIAYALQGIAWLMVLVGGIITCYHGHAAVKALEGNRDDQRVARRSRWTGYLTLSVSALVFLIVTLVGWGLIAVAIRRLVADQSYASLLFPDSRTVGDLIDGFLDDGVWVTLPLLLSLSAIAAVPAIWGMVPSVYTEIRKPPIDVAQSGQYSRRLGLWLTTAFAGLKAAGVLVYVTVIFVLPAAIALVTIIRWHLLGDTDFAMSSLVGKGIVSIGGLGGAAFGWLFVVRGSLRKAALGFRPVLDVALDVDNWLREHPIGRNPRARICGRYASLLRTICAWRDDNGRPYDALVIIAHSQGTVVTADLLRFLAIERDPDLDRLRPNDPAQDEPLPVTFFTMGCPLRQLYGQRFPRLYGWAAHRQANPMARWQPNDLVQDPIRTAAVPDPNRLRVRQWINAYRSGDYIGRYLWRTDDCEYRWTGDCYGTVAPRLNSTDGQIRTEFCLGAGAHTHYWDDTARPIAWALDDLIREA